MNASNALRSTFCLYQSVIEDVTLNIKEAFNDEGVDDAVLKELKELWEQKLAVTKAVEQEPTVMRKPINPMASNMYSANANFVHMPRQSFNEQSRSTFSSLQAAAPATMRYVSPNLVAMPTSSSFPTTAVRFMSGVPVVANPQQPTGLAVPVGHALSSDGRPIKYVILPQLPVNAPTGNLNSGIVTAASSSVPAGSSLTTAPVTLAPQPGGSGEDLKHKKIIQLDGPGGVSDEEEDDNFGEEDEGLEDDENDDLEDANYAAGIIEDGDPLNSDDDDLVNENPDELFEAEDIVVCQYEKVVRTRTKWKFFLKDGIMNLKGKDYVFNKAVGESEF